MSTFKRIAISNRKLCKRSLAEQIKRLGVQIDALILREKDLTEAEYRKLAQEVQEVCEKEGVRLICHTFIPAAGEIGCSCIHLPLPLLAESLDQLKDFSYVGASVHSLEEALLAQRLGADYVTAGNIFDTDCKPGVGGKGTGLLREIVGRTSLEVFALGGITDENEEQVRKAGAAGACRMSDYMKR